MPIVAEINGSDLIDACSGIYGRAIVDEDLPNPYDGLKKVHRRIIWAAKDLSGIVPAKNLIADTFKYHVHGDSSIYEAIARLSQPFSYKNPFIAFDSGNGTYAGGTAAAGRYANLTIAPFAKDIFFSGLHLRAIPQILGMDKTAVEPLHYIPAIPTALIMGNLTIGFGYTNRVTPLHLGNVCDLVCHYADHYMKNGNLSPWDYSSVAELFLPEFPIGNVIDNHYELVEAYRKGNFKETIRVRGSYEIHPDRVTVRTIPYGQPFKSVEETLKEKLGGGDGGKKTIDPVGDRLIADMTDSSDGQMTGEFVIYPRRNGDVTKLLEYVDKQIKSSYNFTPIPNYNIKGTVTELSPPILIMLWYRERRQALMVTKRNRLAELSRQLREIRTFLLVVDFKKEVVKILSDRSLEESSRILMERFKLTKNQTYIIQNTRLKVLSTTEKEDLLRQEIEVSAQVEAIKESLMKIDDEIKTTAMKIKKEYDRPRVTLTPKYIGNIKINDCIIQVTSAKELKQYLDNFAGTKYNISVSMYSGSTHYLLSGGRVKSWKHPVNGMYHYQGQIVSGSSSLCTVWLDDGCAMFTHNIFPDDGKGRYYYTTPTSNIIMTNGTIQKNVPLAKHVSLRKTISRGAKSDIIYVYPQTNKVHYLTTISDANPSILTITRIDDDRNRILTMAGYETYIDHIFGSKDVFLNLPKEKLKGRCAASVIHIDDIEKLLDKDGIAKIDLSRKSSGVTKW